MTAHDRDACGDDEIGRAVLARMDRGGGLAWWGLRTDRIEELAARAGAELIPGTIQDPDGTTRDLGPALLPPDDHNGALPFFCQYAEDLAERARVWGERFARAAHPSGALSFAWVEVAVDESVLRDWVMESSIPVRVGSGVDGIKGIGLATAEGEIVIRDEHPGSA